MRIIIAGSREFSDAALLKRTMDEFVKDLDDKVTVVVTGGAKGADKLGLQWAWDRGIKTTTFHPDYDKHGDKQAPVIRNSEMVENADALVAFWSGSSPGTRDTINKARRAGLKVKVILF